MHNSYFHIMALFFILLLLIVYFSKKRINNIETKIFGYMIISSLLDTLLELYLTIIGYGNYNLLVVKIINKIDFIHFISWPMLLLTYVIYMVCPNKIKYNNLKKVTMIVAIILIVIEFFLPINPHSLNGTMWVEGACPTFIYAYVFINLCVLLVLVLINRKKINIQKMLPVYMLILMIAVAMLVRKLDSSLLIMPAIIVFIDYIMFFTIENPDMKLLEEYTKNKELTENVLEARSNLLFKITEDVKTPIRKIKLYSDNILNTKKIEEKDNNAKNISIESLNLLNNVNDVLNISTIDKKNVKIFDAKYDIYNLYNQIIYIIKSKINKNIDFKYSINNALPEKLDGDSSKLKQIILSLLLYNIKNNEKGTIDLDIYSIVKYDICRLVITINTSLCKLNLTEINDIISGCIEIDDTKAKELNELECDLKIIKKLVDILGGTLLITSDDSGTIFKVIINQLIEDNNSTKELDTISKKLSNKKKILLVDDNYQELIKISNEFKKQNYDVVSIMYGEDILDRLSDKEHFDMLVIDDEMSSGNAVELIKKVDKIKNDITKIVMLEKGKESIKKHYISDYSFADYLLKDNYKEEIKRIKDKYK